jgi:hypothetical protein
MAWSVWGPNHGMANVFLSSKMSRPPLGPTQPYIEVGSGVLSWGSSSWGVKLITNVYLVLRLRMSRALPHLLYVPSRRGHTRTRTQPVILLSVSSFQPQT